MLGRQCGADLVELLNLARNTAQPLVDLFPHVNQVDVIERVVHRTL